MCPFSPNNVDRIAQYVKKGEGRKEGMGAVRVDLSTFPGNTVVNARKVFSLVQSVENFPLNQYCCMWKEFDSLVPNGNVTRTCWDEVTFSARMYVCRKVNRCQN